MPFQTLFKVKINEREKGLICFDNCFNFVVIDHICMIASKVFHKSIKHRAKFDNIDE